MSKTEIYSWRLTADLKRRLEAAARREGTSIGGLIEVAVLEHVTKRDVSDDAAEQVRLRQELSGVIGAYRSEDRLGSVEVKQRIGARIAEKLGRG